MGVELTDTVLSCSTVQNPFIQRVSVVFAEKWMGRKGSDMYLMCYIVAGRRFLPRDIKGTWQRLPALC